MAGKNDMIVGILIGAAILWAVGGGLGGTTDNGGDTGDSGSADVDLSQVVQPSISLTANTKFATGTAITTEYARIIKKNGDGTDKDLSYVSLDSGTKSTDPNGHYRIYWAENGSTYYTEVEDYIALPKEAVDDKSVSLCTIDTDPTVTVFDENGQVQSGGSNTQAVGNDDTVAISLRVKAATEKCYGNPDQDVTGKNAICFRYQTAEIQSVETNTGAAPKIPYSVSSAYSAANHGISCWNLDKLANLGKQDIDVIIKSTAAGPANATENNVTIYLDDIAFDLHANDLSEIYGFEDEDNNALGSAVVTGDYIALT